MQLGFRNFVGVVLLAVVLVGLHACYTRPDDTTTASATAPLTGDSDAEGDRPPEISADAAAYARAGEPYEFKPKVSNAGDHLKFTAENLPPWAHLDPATGAITGTPADADVGAYESITVTVADGSQRASTPPFSITVVPRVTVAATLEWEPPMAKGDGSPLDDLAGYRIVYGRSADELDHSVYIDDPAQTSYEFTDLAPGVWYFAVIAVNANGLEGPPTPPAMKYI
ncbi:MAG TPA: putative Ig domain-containing protein [Steroidobacteraceae bacterium]|nr:putative Ig domain-containing protein [Steroidobacteraceae bacterium]